MILIPRSRAEVRGPLSLALWAIFGNDDDGICGEKIPAGVLRGFGGGQESFTLFLRWWWRNPHHNLSFHVLLRPVTAPVYLIGKSEPCSGEIKRTFVLRFKPFFLKVGYFFVGWRSDAPFEGAWGWAGKGGGKFDTGLKNLG